MKEAKKYTGRERFERWPSRALTACRWVSHSVSMSFNFLTDEIGLIN